MVQRNFNTSLTGEERRRIGEMVKDLQNDSGISQIEKGTLDYRIDALIVILDHFGRKISFI